MLETVFNILKIAVIVAIASLFMSAINGLIGFLGSLLFGGVIVEILGILSCCAPFNAMAVFGSLITVCNAILSFLIAKKIFDLTSWGVSAV